MPIGRKEDKEFSLGSWDKLATLGELFETSIVVYCFTRKEIPMRLYLSQQEGRSELEDPIRKITDATDADWALKPEIV